MGDECRCRSAQHPIETGLHRLFVEEEQLAISIGGFQFEGFDPGLVYFYATLPPGGDPGLLEQRLFEELARVEGSSIPEGQVLVRLEPEGIREMDDALIAQKLDVDEELDRLESHVTEIRHALAGEEPVGRRLDFLMQELNREANTLGSKSAATDTTRIAVELKVLIEQMREQVQNIE